MRNMAVGLLQTIKSLSRRSKMCLAMVMDVIIAPLALWMMYASQKLEWIPSAISQHWWLLPLASVTIVVVFYVFRQYHTVIRFA
jgi:formate hydrogenlyase subunit 4